MYQVCEHLIKDICNELNADEEKQAELIEKYLSKTFVKVKPAKDENKPKRSANAYQLFSNEKRPEVAKKYPDEQMGFISKKLGEMWKKIKESDKQKYIDEANSLKEEYDEKMKEYNLSK
jgi:ABC-type transporter MlaC component